MRIALALVFGVAACGGSGGGLDAAMAGTWNGTASVTMAGLQPLSYQGQLIVAVSGDTATVRQVCSNGSGSISASGTGSTAQWHGTLSCPPVAFSDCASVTFTFNSGNMSLTNGALVAQGAATGAGCGVTRAASFSFTGTK
jgi:hypothetical protein